MDIDKTSTQVVPKTVVPSNTKPPVPIFQIFLYLFFLYLIAILYMIIAFFVGIWPYPSSYLIDPMTKEPVEGDPFDFANGYDPINVAAWKMDVWAGSSYSYIRMLYDLNKAEFEACYQPGATPNNC